MFNTYKHIAFHNINADICVLATDNYEMINKPISLYLSFNFPVKRKLLQIISLPNYEFI